MLEAPHVPIFPAFPESADLGKQCEPMRDMNNLADMGIMPEGSPETKSESIVSGASVPEMLPPASELGDVPRSISEDGSNAPVTFSGGWSGQFSTRSGGPSERPVAGTTFDAASTSPSGGTGATSVTGANQRYADALLQT